MEHILQCFCYNGREGQESLKKNTACGLCSQSISRSTVIEV